MAMNYPIIRAESKDIHVQFDAIKSEFLLCVELGMSIIIEK